MYIPDGSGSYDILGQGMFTYIIVTMCEFLYLADYYSEQDYLAT